MARSETTTAALVLTGVVVALGQGWLTSARAWIAGKAHTASAAGPAPSASATPPGADFGGAPGAAVGSFTPTGVDGATAAAKAAGFTGDALRTIVAIAGAESGWNPQATASNHDGSVDRGMFQINSRWHPEVSDACAFDPACAARAAYRISGTGHSFAAWSTWVNGAWRKYLPQATAATGADATSAGTAVRTW